MATITGTSMLGQGAREITVTTLGASDTFTYDEGKNQIMVFNNVTAGALTPNFDGDGQTSVNIKGIGAVDVSSGVTLSSIAAGEYWAIPLNTIKEYLKGTIALTGGDAMEVQLLEY